MIAPPPAGVLDFGVTVTTIFVPAFMVSSLPIFTSFISPVALPAASFTASSLLTVNVPPAVLKVVTVVVVPPVVPVPPFVVTFAVVTPALFPPPNILLIEPPAVVTFVVVETA